MGRSKKRMKELGKLLPGTDIPNLVERCPCLLLISIERAKEVMNELQRACPTADVVRTVSWTPMTLYRDPSIFIQKGRLVWMDG